MLSLSRATTVLRTGARRRHAIAALRILVVSFYAPYAFRWQLSQWWEVELGAAHAVLSGANSQQAIEQSMAVVTQQFFQQWLNKAIWAVACACERLPPIDSVEHVVAAANATTTQTLGVQFCASAGRGDKCVVWIAVLSHPRARWTRPEYPCSIPTNMSPPGSRDRFVFHRRVACSRAKDTHSELCDEAK